MKKLFSAAPLWPDAGLAFVRVIVGFFMIYHGWEVFDEAKMKEYITWDSFKAYSSPAFMVYLGKIAELVAGVMMAVGFLTRIGSLFLICTMFYISFFVGHGKVWYEDQHPFLFVLLGFVFFFLGSGKYSVDHSIFKKTI